MPYKEFSNLNISQGLTLNQWKTLQSSLDKAVDPNSWIMQVKKQFPNFAEKALEAGFYKLAAQIGCSNPLLQTRALILSSQKNSAIAFVSSLNIGIDKTFCEILLARTQGQSLKIYEEYSAKIDSLFSQCAWDQEIEARLQWAHVLYSLEKWTEVLSLYKVIYELAEKYKQQGAMAITAFNIATVYENLNQRIESKTWLWLSQKNLESYCLDHLKDSIELYEIQCALKEMSDENVIKISEAYLRKDHLGVMQRIRALHALAESQMEYGQILDSELTLSLSRKLIQQNHYDQYSGSQEVLELNLASIVHRPSRFQNRKNLEKYSLNLGHKAAQARWAFKMNDQSRALRLALEIKKESFQCEQFEDLFVLLSNRLEQPGKRARVLEHQILKSWMAKQWKALEYIKTFLDIEKSDSPWKKALSYLSVGILSYLQFETEKSLQSWILCYEVSRNYGLERLETLLATLLKTLHKQPITLSHDLLPEELAFYESLITKLTSDPISVARNEKGQVSLGAEKTDLIFDEDKNEVIWQDQVISLQSQSILLRMLKTLLHNSQGVNKERLVEHVWGFEYHPLHHDPMIYSAMGRLRDLIPVEMSDGIYKIPSSIRWTYLSQNKKDTFKLNPRQKRLMQVLEDESSLSRKVVVELLGVSERTALRELTSLVRMGLLVQNGAGRGVYYSKWNQGA